MEEKAEVIKERTLTNISQGLT